MNQGKLDMVKQEMAKEIIDILGICTWVQSQKWQNDLGEMYEKGESVCVCVCVCTVIGYRGLKGNPEQVS